MDKSIKVKQNSKNINAHSGTYGALMTKNASQPSGQWPTAADQSLEQWQKAASKSAPNGNPDALGWDTLDG
ncbi:MAG: hypothetical protein EBY91_01560, partial [Burkholderiaceae bacterium]|nr:hypothetical protein [Burkholderiaceae bacterium]